MEKNKVGKCGCSYRHGDLTERMSVRPNEDEGISQHYMGKSTQNRENSKSKALKQDSPWFL